MPSTHEKSAKKTPIDAKHDWQYGMFIHYGLYSLLGRGEWVMNREKIPREEYAELARRFTAEHFDADKICDLAVRAGMRYIVLTTMHLEGFRLYDTSLSDFSTAKTAAKRDLVNELVIAARKRGLRVGLYHALNNWMDQPDAADALENKQVYERFVRATFDRIQELVTRFNPIDMLWYDGWWPFDAKGWRAEEMNAMVRQIQPNIVLNGRNGLPGDFATPEGQIIAPSPWRPWEACMTLNNSWGFHSGDHDWKTPTQIVDLLTQCAMGHGSLLLNIGPRGDGSIPEPSIRVLETVGQWLKDCGDCIYDTELFSFDLNVRGEHRSDWTTAGSFTAKGNSFYLLVRKWPGATLTLAGIECRVKSVSLLRPRRDLVYEQYGDKVMIKGLPLESPDPVCPVIRFDCDRAPSIYLTGGTRTPKVAHPHYDPCVSELGANQRPG